MNQLGIIVDVSHASDQTTWDVLKTSTRPVIASHSNARAIRDHPRNLTDEMIEAIAASGGLVGVVAVAGYISETEATVAHWADHIDHIVGLVGIDHVGVGCDFYDDIMAMGASQEIPAWNPGGGLGQLSFDGMRTWADLPRLTAELLRRGYTETAVSSIYKENFSRVLDAVLSV
jgi:membrane dipeptidase